jgi:hypothetical protein
MLMIAVLLSGAVGCGDDDDDANPDAGPALDGSPGGSGGSDQPHGTGGKMGGTGGHTVACGPCPVALDIVVKEPGGAAATNWTAHIRGDDIDCVSSSSSDQCAYRVAAGDYEVAVSAGCNHWTKQVHIEASHPGPNTVCDCGFVPEQLVLRKSAQDCDHDGGSDDGGADDAGS